MTAQVLSLVDRLPNAVHASLLGIMLRFISRQHPEFHRVEQHLRSVLQHTDCPELKLDTGELARLERLLADLDPLDPQVRFEALFTSSFYMGAVGGWNPNMAQPLRELPFNMGTKLLIELAYGVLGFAWQIHYHQPIILTQAEYYDLRDRRKTP